MEFRILGPLEVVADGKALDLGGQKQRALLGALSSRQTGWSPLTASSDRRASPQEALDELNLADGRVYVGTTRWAGRVGFRPAFVNWRTTAADADLMLETVRDLGHRLV
jgi:hypothetical protein